MTPLAKFRDMRWSPWKFRGPGDTVCQVQGPTDTILEVKEPGWHSGPTLGTGDEFFSLQKIFIDHMEKIQTRFLVLLYDESEIGVC